MIGSTSFCSPLPATREPATTAQRRAHAFQKSRSVPQLPADKPLSTELRREKVIEELRQRCLPGEKNQSPSHLRKSGSRVMTPNLQSSSLPQILKPGPFSPQASLELAATELPANYLQELIEQKRQVIATAERNRKLEELEVLFALYSNSLATTLYLALEKLKSSVHCSLTKMCYLANVGETKSVEPAKEGQKGQTVALFAHPLLTEDNRIDLSIQVMLATVETGSFKVAFQAVDLNSMTAKVILLTPLSNLVVDPQRDIHQEWRILSLADATDREEKLLKKIQLIENGIKTDRIFYFSDNEQMVQAIVQDFYEGQQLSDLPGILSSSCSKKVAWSLRCQTAERLVQQLMAIHQQEIIHLDLKAENILFKISTSAATEEEEDVESIAIDIAIVDFGFSITFTEPQPPSTTPYRGTPVFWSPEQIFDILLQKKIIDGQYQPITEKTDYWQLAIVLHQLLIDPYPGNPEHSSYPSFLAPWFCLHNQYLQQLLTDAPDQQLLRAYSLLADPQPPSPEETVYGVIWRLAYERTPLDQLLKELEKLKTLEEAPTAKESAFWTS